MKTNRTPRNGSASRATKQAPTKPEAAAKATWQKQRHIRLRAKLAKFVAASDATKPVTLVFTLPDGRECARVPMTGQLFTWLKLAARQLGVSMSEFVEQAVREDIKRAAREAVMERAVA